MYDVISVGSATVDVFAKTEFSEMVKILTPGKETELIVYPSGEKIIINDLHFTTGGGGTNTAVAFSRLGLRTAYCGRVGNDENGKKIISELKKEKIDFVGTIGKEMSGYSIILDSIEHDRTILCYKGCNNNFKFSDLKQSKLKAKWFYLCTMMGESYKALEKLAEFAKKKRIKVAFNPSTYLAKKGAKFLKKLISMTDLLVLNKKEACYILGDSSIEKLLINLYNMGPETVVITDGKKGAYVFDGYCEYTVKPNKVKVVESTGAGDAFTSSFLAGLIMKDDIKFALNLAVVNSESILQHYGAKGILLKKAEALAAIKKKAAKITKRKM